MTIQAVIFDIGNVLIEWQPERYYDRVIGEDRRRAMFDAVDLHWMNERSDRGENYRDVIYETADANPEFRDEIRLWHDKWIELAAPAIPHSVHLMRQLRAKGVPVFSLTNFGKESFAETRLHYDFLNEFDQQYVSGELRVTKPDPEIYRIVEERSGLSPDTLLFADDRPDNVDIGRARGWNAHLFEGPAGWAACLVGHGLLTEAEAAL